ncbi:Pleckstrin-like proteiny domain-containing family H member 3 [Macaca mulatta]|uniref:Pleckstrin homology domain-containing family H member 3 n=1 Tax=Macaca mulatta TaxID=9544 RepID=G7NIM2_MACMU|nr:Pleckstrin-like proteiny domain-containing family H member 3 [Macaca mulatta]
MPLPGGLWWLLCCRRGFTLLHRDYGDGELSGDGDEDEDEETFELRTPSPAGGGRGPLEVTLTQPVRSGPVSNRLQSWEETWSLIPEKGLPEDDPDIVVKGWLYREPRGGGARPWLPPRRAWFVLTRDSLDQFSSSGKGARRLGSLVLTSLCSVTGPERRRKETGLWSVTVSGRKHSVSLCSPRQAEAERWGVALREVIASKAPLETPTQLLLRDIQESCGDPEAVALIYLRNPILRHTSGALYAPLLPLPYGVSAPGPGYAPLREEAVRLFLALQALEGARRPGPLMQGVLQTCRDLPALRDELFLQLAKQTSGPAGPPGLPATQDPATLRYWQLLTCMSCTFRPGGAVRGHLLGHLERTEQALPDSELAEYARFIRKALGRTRGRELVPSLAEISALSQRQELLCTVHCPGAGACTVAIDSHTTAGEVARELVGRLGLARSRNAFALYEQRGTQERALAGGTLVADVLTRFENLAAEEAGLEDSPDSGWRLCLRLHGPLHAMAAYLALAAQCPGFGAARYDVLELSTEPGGGAPQKLCLGLGAKAMSLSRPGETEPIHSVSYGHVAACQLMGPHTLALRVGESQLLLQSPQVEEIMQLVNAYLANPSPERPCSSSSRPCQDLPDTSPPSQHPGLDEPQGQSGCLGQLQD